MGELGKRDEIVRQATVRDLHEVIDDHARYWGERDLRSLHVCALVHEFPETSLVAVGDDGIRGYILGFVTPARVAYAHLIATRDDTRGTGLGRRLYTAFATAASQQGAVQLKAITSPTNEGSISFHRSLDFEARLIEDYDGPGQPRMVFTRDLSQPLS
ncbi:GNAT family N-acetyltransferase [Nocardia suismassiliense]|uniref:GNAT family N-acetyltransferase n=1 Tax=Nocardia suismassiliense TaxID=2077092 RepID=A0ABW6R5S9_9NOCA